MKSHRFSFALTGLLIMLGSGLSNTALAVEKGDWLLHVRAINIDPDDSSSALNVGGATLAGTGVSVDSGATLDVSLGYMLTDNWAVELLADLSSSHDVNVFGLPGALNVPDGTKVIDARVLPPTLFLQYQFNPTASIRPYAGIGLNYTLFFDDDLTTAAQTALGASNLDLDDSFGLAAQIGVDFAMRNDWSFNLDLKYIKIDTQATFDTALGPVSVDVDIDPLVLGIGFGKTF